MMPHATKTGFFEAIPEDHSTQNSKFRSCGKTKQIKMTQHKIVKYNMNQLPNNAKKTTLMKNAKVCLALFNQYTLNSYHNPKDTSQCRLSAPSSFLCIQ